MVTVPTALATSEQLATWTGAAAPSNATQLLRSATSLILENVTAIYDTNDEGVATDANIMQAMQDAVCIQAAAWAAIKFNPLTGGVPAGAMTASKSIGSAQVTVAGAGRAADAQWESYDALVPEAARRLAQQNLLDPHLLAY